VTEGKSYGGKILKENIYIIYTLK